MDSTACDCSSRDPSERPSESERDRPNDNKDNREETIVHGRLTFLRFTGANRMLNSIELETHQRAVRARCNR